MCQQPEVVVWDEVEWVPCPVSLWFFFSFLQFLYQLRNCLSNTSGIILWEKKNGLLFAFYGIGRNLEMKMDTENTQPLYMN